MAYYENKEQSSKFAKNLDTNSFEKTEEINKLKSIIEKSYYSIKQMESEIQKLNEQINTEKKSHRNTEKKFKIVAFEKEEL